MKSIAIILLLALPACAQQGVGTRPAMQTAPTITVGWNAGHGTFSKIVSSTNLALPINQWATRTTAAIKYAGQQQQATFPRTEAQEYFIGKSE